MDQIVDARTGLSKMGGPPYFWLHCDKKMLGQVDFVFFLDAQYFLMTSLIFEIWCHQQFFLMATSFLIAPIKITLFCVGTTNFRYENCIHNNVMTKKNVYHENIWMYYNRKFSICTQKNMLLYGKFCGMGFFYLLIYYILRILNNIL